MAQIPVMTQVPNNKVKLTLVGLSGNAFVLMAAFRKAAVDQGFNQNYIQSVIDDCQSGDYNHLIAVLLEHTEPDDDDYDDYDDDDYDDDDYDDDD